MSRNLETLNETDTIASAARRMAEDGVGFLPICDTRGKLMGVVTDRDLVTRGLARGLDARTTSAAMVMTAPGLTCRADADLLRAEELMASERKSRLVIVHDDGTVAGVLSIADIVEHGPKREALGTLKAVLWREALGPRGGARPGTRMLRDLPLAPPAPNDDGATPATTVFTGGHHDAGTKEFPS
jgi:signal-transduction protein with cAMP-binding, CBS, and nucleotidyltransferase domain